MKPGGSWTSTLIGAGVVALVGDAHVEPREPARRGGVGLERDVGLGGGGREQQRRGGRGQDGSAHGGCLLHSIGTL